ncbi:MFS transporter [Haladaptatus sp. AB643]|uniref:MFS transporter n=1 Tax=Haladaptatus sp. AB643 TaxID=2934174 RepID=UPI00209C51CE|nr:MFS transporter [Haladaptatus sp. AB643]MCO8246778.1 MFS transporter [Haladaptatus sp. AB643]
MATTVSNVHEDTLDSAQGWLVVALGVCMLTSIWGSLFTFTVYADRLSAAFGLTALQASSIFSITTAFFLIVGGLFGIFAARFPLRPVVAAVGVGLGVAAALLQVVHSYVGVLAAFAVLGTSGGTAFTVVVSLAPQWFDDYRGVATSITMTGVGLGPLVLPFVWLWLFDRMNFRAAFAVVVGVAAGLVLVSSLAYRRPQNRSRNGRTIDIAWLRGRIGDSYFLRTALGYALIWTWYYVLASHLVTILTTNNVDRTVAATGLSIIGGVSVVTRIGGGLVGDRVGRRRTFIASVVLAAVFVFALPFVHSNTMIYVVLVGLGASLGPLASLWSPIILTRFGPENATATVGLLNISIALSAFLGPLAVSVLDSMTGGYVAPLVAVSVVTVLGAGLFYRGTTSEGE